MADVTELRVALTVEDFDQALAFYRDALGLSKLPTGVRRPAGSSSSTRAGRRSSFSTMRRPSRLTRLKLAAGCPERSGSR